MKRNIFAFPVTAALITAVLSLFPLCAAGRPGGSAAVQYSGRDFRKITSMTAQILNKNHYSLPAMTPELSGKIFDQYFNTLDPLHMFFTGEDVAKFLPVRENLGWQLMRGEYQFAFQVYTIYKQRYAEYRSFTEKMLASEIDFNVDEEIVTDRSKHPRPANQNELHEVWRKQIKNDLLNFRLSERAAKEELKKEKNANADTKPRDPKKSILRRQRDVGNSINKRDKIDILGLLLDSMAGTYGAHCDYQAPKLSEDFEIHMSLSLCGIGATLTSEDGYIKVVELVKKGPAEKSGKIKVNDRIVSVTQEDGETVDLIDMPVSQAVQYIRGKENTRVTLDILSGNSAVPAKVELVREKVQLEADAAKGEIKEINGVKVGVITLPSFYMDFSAAIRGDANARRASSDVAKILDNFNKQGINSLVFDLRNNGGGSLPDAIVLSGLFLNGGPVVQVRYNSGTRQERDPSEALLYSGPMVVLTNKFSASAAEIFTGALSDAKRAVVVGDSRTFGKGTVLQVESLSEYTNWFRRSVPSGSLTFEVAMFFRPAGDSVQQLGIKPDIILPALTDEMKIGEIYLENHLPWASIEPVKLNIWDKELDKKVSVLKEKSAARIKENRLYQTYIRQIELFREIRDRKKLSLNEEKRYMEYRREKAISDEVERQLSAAAESAEKDKKNKDLVLEEAVNIAADLSKL